MHKGRLFLVAAMCGITMAFSPKEKELDEIAANETNTKMVEQQFQYHKVKVLQ